MNWNKLIEIIAVVKSANQKNFSELTDEQKVAVMFACSYFPAKMNAAGKLEYDVTSKEVVFSPPFMEWRKILKMSPEPIKGFGKASCLVVVDEVLPSFQETTFQKALEAYPSNLVPKKETKYHNLDNLERAPISYDPDPVKIARAFAEINARLIYNLEMPRNVEAIHMMMHLHRDNAKRLGEKFGMVGAVINILNISPQRTIQQEYESEGQTLIYNKFDLPRGTVDPDRFTGTYLAKYITLAMDNIFLKAE